jgi:hypothetical protein
MPSQPSGSSLREWYKSWYQVRAEVDCTQFGMTGSSSRVNTPRHFRREIARSMYASYRRLRARLVHPLPAEILLIRDNPAADAVGLRPSLDPDPLLGAPSQNVKGVETGATCR